MASITITRCVIAVILIITLVPSNEVGCNQPDQKRNEEECDRSNCFAHVKRLFSSPKSHPFSALDDSLCSGANPNDKPAKDIKRLLAEYMRERDQIRMFKSTKTHFEALSLFAGLEISRLQVDQANEASFAGFCGQESASKMQKIQKEIEVYLEEMSVNDNEGYCGRLMEVYRFLMRHHWQNCIPRHGRNFDEAFDEVDKPTLSMIQEFIERVTNYVVNEMFPGRTGELLSQKEKLEAIRRLEYLDDFELQRYAVLSFKDGFLDQQPGGLIKVSENEMVGLLNEYMYKPCIYYTTKLDHVLESAALDLDNLFEHPPADEADFHKFESQFFSSSKDEQKFFARWADWTTCYKLLDLDYRPLGGALHRLAIGSDRG